MAPGILVVALVVVGEILFLDLAYALGVGQHRLLDAAERNRATSYLSALDGARFAASRAGLRRILGRYLDADPAELRFDRDPGGRPVLASLEFHLADMFVFTVYRRGPRVVQERAYEAAHD